MEKDSLIRLLHVARANFRVKSEEGVGPELVASFNTFLC